MSKKNKKQKKQVYRVTDNSSSYFNRNENVIKVGRAYKGLVMMSSLERNYTCRISHALIQPVDGMYHELQA